MLLVTFGPSGSGRAVGGAAAGGRGKDGGVASWPGAVLGVVDAVSCGGGNRGGNDAELAEQGLVVSGGEVMSGTGAVGAGIVRVRRHYLLSASTRRSISASTLPVFGSSRLASWSLSSALVRPS